MLECILLALKKLLIFAYIIKLYSSIYCIFKTYLFNNNINNNTILWTSHKFQFEPIRNIYNVTNSDHIIVLDRSLNFEPSSSTPKISISWQFSPVVIWQLLHFRWWLSHSRTQSRHPISLRQYVQTTGLIMMSRQNVHFNSKEAVSTTSRN